MIYYIHWALKLNLASILVWPCLALPLHWLGQTKSFLDILIDRVDMNTFGHDFFCKKFLQYKFYMTEKNMSKIMCYVLDIKFN